uniref:Plasmalemma vesicle associated protein a n=1 Tax=Astyanax mexicanus TaxID=7994 RepID=A0A8B9RGG2_ASTMX
MYNSGYSHTKMGLAAKNLHKSKERSCGYYMRIVLFFSSLIQSLIIVSLVLFLVYGEPQQTVEEKRIQELEQSYSRLSLENVALRAKEKNLTLFKFVLKKYDCSGLCMCFAFHRLSVRRRDPMGCLVQVWLDLLLLYMFRLEHFQWVCCHLVKTYSSRIKWNMSTIELRREKALLEERLDIYEKKCKEDFIKSLQGIPDVTKEFLKRVDDLFSKHISFQLTCEKQSLQLENIRANCSSLSSEVENKLQLYLDKVGSQITQTVGENAKCLTENKRLNEDTSWCIRNRSEIIEGNKKILKQTQQNNDKEVEHLLLDIRKLNANTNLLENSLSVKNIEIKMLNDKVNDLNAKPGVNNDMK